MIGLSFFPMSEIFTSLSRSRLIMWSPKGLLLWTGSFIPSNALELSGVLHTPQWWFLAFPVSTFPANETSILSFLLDFNPLSRPFNICCSCFIADILLNRFKTTSFLSPERSLVDLYKIGALDFCNNAKGPKFDEVFQ